MRTTLAIDDDVFFAVQQQARREKTSLGAKVSELLRKGISTSALPQGVSAPTLHPFVLYPKRDGEVITSEDVYRWIDEMESEP